MTVASLTVRVGADLSELKKIRQGVARAIEPVRAQLKSLGQTMTRYVTAPLAGIGAASVKVASDVEEMRGKFNVVFGDLASQTETWASAHAKAVGRSKYELMGYAAQLQDTFVPMGVARSEAAGLSKNMAQLAVDLASFNNASEPETVDLLTSALVGNHEAVRRFGVVITQATLEAELLNMGIRGGAKAASEQQKMMARMEIIMRSTSDAQGDAARTSGSFANQMRGLQAVLKDVGVSMGEILLPEARKLVAWAREALERFDGLEPSVKRIIVIVGGLAAAIGPLLLALGSVAGLLPTLAAGFALLSGPVGLTVAAVAALAGIATVIYKNWEGVSGFFAGLWQKVTTQTRTAADLLVELIKGIWPRAQQLFIKGVEKLLEPMKWLLELLGVGSLSTHIEAFQARIGGLVPEQAARENAARIAALKSELQGGLGDLVLDVHGAGVSISGSVSSMVEDVKGWLTGSGGLVETASEAGAAIERIAARTQAAVEQMFGATASLRAAVRGPEALGPDDGFVVKTNVEKDAERLGIDVGPLREVNAVLDETREKVGETTAAVRDELSLAFERLSELVAHSFADVLVGFQSLSDVMSSLGEMVKLLIRDLIAAIIRAQILQAVTKDAAGSGASAGGGSSAGGSSAFGSSALAKLGPLGMGAAMIFTAIGRFAGAKKWRDDYKKEVDSWFGGARASGGPVSFGKTYLVGERGPELFTPGGSGTIIANHKLQSASAGMREAGARLTERGPQRLEIRPGEFRMENGAILASVRAALKDEKRAGLSTGTL